MIKIKTDREIELIRAACQIVNRVMRHLRSCLQPGITTQYLDEQAAAMLKKMGALSAFKGYRGYPAHICTSVNEEIVHGIPGKRRLKEGDIISIDIGVKLNGYFGDAACTYPVGTISLQAQRLLEVTIDALTQGIARAKKDNHLLDISNAIQTYVESSGRSVVRKFVGHGIGSNMHEEPEIPNFGQPGQGPILKTGMVLAIEPMVNEGGPEVEILKDNWTAITKDNKLSAHFEHTVCITADEPEILTSWE